MNESHDRFGSRTIFLRTLRDAWRPKSVMISRRHWLRNATALVAASTLTPLLRGSPEVSKQELSFSLSTDQIWRLPQKAGDEHKVKIELAIKNNSPKDLNVSLFDTLTPIVTFPDGKSQQLEIMRLRTGDIRPIAVASGKTATIAYDVRVYWIKGGDGAAATISDLPGGAWTINNLPAGKYSIASDYQNKEAAYHDGTALWVGQATIRPVGFEAAL